MTLETIYRPIAPHLAAVEQLIGDATDPRLRHIIAGKRLRAALLLFSARVWKPEARHRRSAGGRDAIDVAAAIELVHLASLIHDDVLDSSRRRRRGPALHATIGIKPAVILADLAFVNGLARLESMRGRRIVTDTIAAVRLMCEGQWLEVKAGHRTTEAQYFEIIEKKTAALFAYACRVGAELAGDSIVVPVLEEFGHDFGFAYQLLDDARDLGAENPNPLERRLREWGGVRYCRQLAAVYAAGAGRTARRLPDPTQRLGMQRLLDYVRSHD